jgi:uncharacterized protein (TIGR02453 family)
VRQPGFAGFQREGIQFLRSLARNNRREWFQARKELYESRVRQPMLALVGEINHALAAFAPEYVTEPEKAVYRIYRDTRFSSDKTPYKRHVAAVFNRRGLAKNCGAGFYFSVSPTEIEIAGGVYMPGPEELFAIRSHITENYNEFRKRVTHIRLRRAMEDLKGESLSRSPKGFDPLHPAAAYVRMKQWLFWTTLDPGLACTGRLYPEIVTRFRLMAPVIDFLNMPLANRRRRVVPDLIA